MHLHGSDRILEQDMGTRVVASGEKIPQVMATRVLLASANMDDS
mgnify:FL=1|jgi:hypothetical protein